MVDCKVSGAWKAAEITGVNQKLKLLQVSNIWLQFSTDLLAPALSQISVVCFCCVDMWILYGHHQMK